MYYPHLTKELGRYVRALQLSAKSAVQIKTGALQRSITVRCTVDSQEYSMSLSLNHYWRYLIQPFPWSTAFEAAGLEPPEDTLHHRYPSDLSGERYTFNFRSWEQRLNNAYEKDVVEFINNNISFI